MNYKRYDFYFNFIGEINKRRVINRSNISTNDPMIFPNLLPSDIEGELLMITNG